MDILIAAALKSNMKTTPSHWYVYMVSCADSSIYTGITTDLQRRMLEHNSPRGGARYTRSRQPVILVYYEEYPDRSLASKREFHLKKLSAGRKRALVTSAYGAPGVGVYARHGAHF